MWNLVFFLFGVQWLVSRSEFAPLACWKRQFGKQEIPKFGRQFLYALCGASREKGMLHVGGIRVFYKEAEAFSPKDSIQMDEGYESTIFLTVKNGSRFF